MRREATAGRKCNPRRDRQNRDGREGSRYSVRPRDSSLAARRLAGVPDRTRQSPRDVNANHCRRLAAGVPEWQTSMKDWQAPYSPHTPSVASLTPRPPAQTTTPHCRRPCPDGTARPFPLHPHSNRGPRNVARARRPPSACRSCGSNI